MTTAREIKFRAWWQPTELKYHRGILKNPPHMLQVGDNSGTKTGLDCCVYANQGQNVILLQYIGLKDLNGKEGYEGDILDGLLSGCYIDYCDNCCCDQVFLFDGTCQRCNGDMMWSELVESIRNGESWFIGDMYSNPELLEVRHG